MYYQSWFYFIYFDFEFDIWQKKILLRTKGSIKRRKIISIVRAAPGTGMSDRM